VTEDNIWKLREKLLKGFTEKETQEKEEEEESEEEDRRIVPRQ
jgi:hypothetical protein